MTSFVTAAVRHLPIPILKVSGESRRGAIEIVFLVGEVIIHLN